MKLADILAKKDIQGVETIGTQETLGGLVARLSDRRIGAMMATDASGAIAGVISERDVVRALAKDGETALHSPVSLYMTQEVETATPEDGAVSILERMTAGRFRHMPVMAQGELIGVVSIGDLVKARIEALQRDNAALEEFIRS